MDLFYAKYPKSKPRRRRRKPANTKPDEGDKSENSDSGSATSGLIQSVVSPKKPTKAKKPDNNPQLQKELDQNKQYIRKLSEIIKQLSTESQQTV